MFNGEVETDEIFDKVGISVTDDKVDVEAINVKLEVCVIVIADEALKKDVAELIGEKVAERDGNIEGESVKSVEAVGMTVYDTVTRGLIVESLDFPAETVKILD